MDLDDADEIAELRTIRELMKRKGAKALMGFLLSENEDSAE